MPGAVPSEWQVSRDGGAGRTTCCASGSRSGREHQAPENRTACADGPEPDPLDEQTVQGALAAYQSRNLGVCMAGSVRRGRRFPWSRRSCSVCAQRLSSRFQASHVGTSVPPLTAAQWSEQYSVDHEALLEEISRRAEVAPVNMRLAPVQTLGQTSQLYRMSQVAPSWRHVCRIHGTTLSCSVCLSEFGLCSVQARRTEQVVSVCSQS